MLLLQDNNKIEIIINVKRFIVQYYIYLFNMHLSIIAITLNVSGTKVLQIP